jgi:hypothetical protein
MGFATHLGPWLLGTVKDTTGTTAGTLRNTGVTSVAQSKAILFTDITAATYAFTLPAGSIITSAEFITTVAYATSIPTIALFSNGVAINTAANSGSAIGSLGSFAIALIPAAAPGAVLLANVGTTDALITFTQICTATSGAGVLVLQYLVRASDGSQYPASA